MQISKYENLYACVNYAQHTGAAIVDEIAAYMQNNRHPMTCKEIARGVYGEIFDEEDWMQKSRISTISHALSLLSNGYVKREKIPDGAPIEIEVNGRIRVDKLGRPIMITVTAEDGRKFEIVDPSVGSWKDWAIITKKKTVQPKKTVFIWKD